MVEFWPSLEEPETAYLAGTELVRWDPRFVYLITYSRADLQRVRDLGTFAQMVQTAFEAIGAKVELWVCCMEKHQDNNFHFHLATKLARRHRWFWVKEHLNIMPMRTMVTMMTLTLTATMTMTMTMLLTEIMTRTMRPIMMLTLTMMMIRTTKTMTLTLTLTPALTLTMTIYVSLSLYIIMFHYHYISLYVKYI